MNDVVYAVIALFAVFGVVGALSVLLAVRSGQLERRFARRVGAMREATIQDHPRPNSGPMAAGGRGVPRRGRLAGARLRLSPSNGWSKPRRRMPAVGPRAKPRT